MAKSASLSFLYYAVLSALIVFAIALHSITSAQAHGFHYDSPPKEPDLVLTGEVTREDFQDYLYLPFRLPSDIDSIRIKLDHNGRGQRTAIDIGVIDPEGLRGWSGGMQDAFDIGGLSSSPGYLTRPMKPGKWQILLAVPNIREGVTTKYRVRIWFNPTAKPVKAKTGWMRGDFHVHTGHGDATCPTRTGDRQRCPIHRSVETALRAGLSFMAISDHNTVSGFATAAELQLYYDDIVLIPSMELTTFYGHANIFGLKRYLDFRRYKTEESMADLVDDVDAQNALFSINHPLLFLGEDCMGCGWELPIEDYSRVVAVEAVGGGIYARLGTVETPISGINFWERLLNRGYRITGIGGSDNHDPDDPGRSQTPIGAPTTVVWSDEASIDGILTGVRSGRVFIDLVGEPNWILDLNGEAGGKRAPMGSGLKAEIGERIVITANVAGPPGASVEFIPSGKGERIAKPVNGEPLSASASAEFTYSEELKWVRAQLRNADGAVVLVSNPVYLQTD